MIWNNKWGQICLERCADILGIKMIDVRHEQAAAMAAHAYSRVTGKPGVCMTGSGPDCLNLVTGNEKLLVLVVNWAMK